MEALAGIVTVTTLINGVAKIATTLNDIKEKWHYASLNISLVSSSLWAVKAALEEIAEWRSKSNDKSQKSEQLDANLEVCVQSCAILVAVVERTLGDVDLDNLSTWDKARFVRLDSLFKDFSSHLGDQVRALQLLLTIHQCRTLGEQNERLQRTHTRRIVNAVRESAASLNYEDRDISDAASILSETPSTNFAFDSIIMQHQSYSRTYPRLYARMQQNFPSKRDSVVSTIKSSTLKRKPLPKSDPIITQNIALPFLGVPFEGEQVPEESEDESTVQSFGEQAGECSKSLRSVKQVSTDPTVNAEQDAGARLRGRKRKSFNSLYDDSGDEQDTGYRPNASEGVSGAVATDSKSDGPNHVPQDIQDPADPLEESATSHTAKLELFRNDIVEKQESQVSISSENPEQQTGNIEIPSSRGTQEVLQLPNISASKLPAVMLVKGSRREPVNPTDSARNPDFLDINFGPDIDLPLTPRKPSSQDDVHINAVASIPTEEQSSSDQLVQQDGVNSTDAAADAAQLVSTGEKNMQSRNSSDTAEPSMSHNPGFQQLASGSQGLKQETESEDDRPLLQQSVHNTDQSMSKEDDHATTMLGQPHEESRPASAETVAQMEQQESFDSSSGQVEPAEHNPVSPTRSQPPVPVTNGNSQRSPKLEQEYATNLTPVQTRLSFNRALYPDPSNRRQSFQSDRSASVIGPSSPVSTQAASSMTSTESSNASRDQATLQTQATSMTMSLPNSIPRVVTDHPQHEKKRLAITSALVKHKISNLGSKLSSSTGVRQARIRSMIEAVDKDDTLALSRLISTLDKSADISTLMVIGNVSTPRTLLMYAAREGQLDCLSVIMSTDPKGSFITDKNGDTVLHHALSASTFVVALWLMTRLAQVRDLRTGQRFIDIVNKQGVALVHLATQSSNGQEVLERLFKTGANMNVEDNKGQTALFYATQGKHQDMVLFLLQQGLDVNHRDANGETPLMAAARTGSASIFDTIFDSGANKELLDNRGNRAIHFAATHGNIYMLEKLFLSVEDVTAKNNIGEQPLHLAAANNNTEVLSALLDIPGVQVNAWTHPPHTKEPVKRAEGLAATKKLACTPLHYACSAGHYEATDILVRRNALVQANQEDGFSPLMMACQAQNVAIVSLLLLNAADPNCATAAEGLTALHIACRNDCTDCVRMLIEHGGDASAKMTNKEKDTPSSLAYRENPPNMRTAAAYSMRYRAQILKMTSPLGQGLNPRYAPNIRLTGTGTGTGSRPIYGVDNRSSIYGRSVAYPPSVPSRDPYPGYFVDGVQDPPPPYRN